MGGTHALMTRTVTHPPGLPPDGDGDGEGEGEGDGEGGSDDGAGAGDRDGAGDGRPGRVGVRAGFGLAGTPAGADGVAAAGWPR
jgi:hypothetical protein